MARREVPTIRARDQNRVYRLITAVQYYPSKENPRRFAFLHRYRQRPNHTASTIGDEYHAVSAPFISTIGTRQGTRCRWYSSSCTSKQTYRYCTDVFQADHNIPNEAKHADDADFISTDHDYASQRVRTNNTRRFDMYLINRKRIY